MYYNQETEIKKNLHYVQGNNHFLSLYLYLIPKFGWTCQEDICVDSSLKII